MIALGFGRFEGVGCNEASRAALAEEGRDKGPTSLERDWLCAADATTAPGATLRTDSPANGAFGPPMVFASAATDEGVASLLVAGPPAVAGVAARAPGSEAPG